MESLFIRWCRSKKKGMDWKLSTPCRLELIGPSHSGKSTCIRKLVSDDTVWDRPFQNIVYAAPHHDEDDIGLLKAVLGDKTLTLLDKIPDIHELRELAIGKPLLLILEDLPGFRDCSSLNDLITIHSHHDQISCIFSVHNPFLRRNKLDLVHLSRNCTGKFLFYTVSDFYVYSMLNSRLFPDKKHFLLQCLKMARERYQLPYIFINTAPHNKLDRRYICYTALFQDERRQFGDSPLFFDLEA